MANGWWPWSNREGNLDSDGKPNDGCLENLQIKF